MAEKPLGDGLRLAVRLCLIALGGAGIWAGIFTMQQELKAEPVRTIARRILRGERYDTKRLKPILAYLDRTDSGRPADCADPNVGNAGIIRADVGSRSDVPDEEADSLLLKARQNFRDMLACSPHEAYYWFALFWVEVAITGKPEDFLSYLEMSYELAPNEGWIQAVRSRVAFRHIDKMPPPLQERVITEYKTMCRWDVRAAASTFAALKPEGRARVLSLLKDVPLEQRRQLALELDRRDVNVDIPGVEYREGHVAPVKR